MKRAAFVCLPILPRQLRAIFCVPFPVFTFCLFLQRNYSAPLSRRGYHSCDYNTVSMATAVQCWQLSKIRSPLVNLNLVQRGGAREPGAQIRGDGGGGGGKVALLTGRWVSTLPFLQRDIIDGDVSLDARSPDTFEYHLQREKKHVCHIMFSASIEHKNKKIRTAAG